MLTPDWPSPDDPNRPNEEFLRVVKQLEEGLQDDPALYAELGKLSDPVAELIRFAKGYYFNQFKDVADPNERLRLSLRILRRCLTWRKQNNVAELHDKQLPRRKEFNQLWPSGVSGLTAEGRVVYMLMPFAPELMKQFTQEEVAWLHFQENEWLVRLKAQESRKRNRMLLDHVVIVDFGNNHTLKSQQPSLGMVNWFREATKFEPADLEKGEQKMDVDGYCYPESLYRMYLLNVSAPLRYIWTVAKKFVYPSTREKFRILGSDMDQIMHQFQVDGVDLGAIPAYLGGHGLNPPGLILLHQLRPGESAMVQVKVPSDHSIYFRFSSKLPTTIDGETSLKQPVCHFDGVGLEWREGNFVEQKEACTCIFKMTSTQATVVQYEVTVSPRLGPGAPLELPPMPSESTVAGPRASWITKRRLFRDSVRSTDQTPLECRKGFLDKWGSYTTGYQQRYFQTNNEYLNYYSDEDTSGPLLGSFNLKKLVHVEASLKGHLILKFEGKHTVWLRALNGKEGQLWRDSLEERQRWFEDVPTAAASARKKALKEAKSAPTPSIPRPALPPPPRPSSRSMNVLTFVLCLLSLVLGLWLGTFIS